MTADRLLRLYPRRWQERYGTELLDTAGQGPLHAQQVLDITMGAIDAWLSSEVRQSTAAPATARPGGKTMPGFMKYACADKQFRMSTTDAIIAAIVFLATTALLSSLGIFAGRSGHPELGDALKSLAFPLSMTLSLPFSFMKGQPWRAQLAIVGTTAVILVIITFAATAI